MARAMDPAVAIQTRLAQQIPLRRRRAARQVIAFVQRTGMLRRHMTRLAKIRHLLLQHRHLIGPVRIVAVATVFPHRRMFPNHRAALFLVAVVTSFVDGRRLELARSRAAMRIVAIGATHLAFAQRHMGRTVHPRPLVFVTHETNFFGIFKNGERLLALARHHVVALVATDVVHFVRASAPTQALPFFMALQTHLGFLLRRQAFEGNDRLGLLAFVFFFKVLARRAVANLAGCADAFARSRLVNTRVLGVGERLEVIVMTLGALRRVADRGRALHRRVERHPIGLFPRRGGPRACEQHPQHQT